MFKPLNLLQPGSTVSGGWKVSLADKDIPGYPYSIYLDIPDNKLKLYIDPKSYMDITTARGVSMQAMTKIAMVEPSVDNRGNWFPVVKLGEENTDHNVVMFNIELDIGDVITSLSAVNLLVLTQQTLFLDHKYIHGVIAFSPDRTTESRLCIEHGIEYSTSRTVRTIVYPPSNEPSISPPDMYRDVVRYETPTPKMEIPALHQVTKDELARILLNNSPSNTSINEGEGRN